MVRLEELLVASLTLRVERIPSPSGEDHSSQDVSSAKLAILFSGGLDCTVLARLVHDILPTTEPIDLLNVAFENPRVHRSDKGETLGGAPGPFELCPDRITGRASTAELKSICPGREWRFVAVNIPYAETLEHRRQIISLMHPHNTEMDLSIAMALYFAARGSGVVGESAAELPRPYRTPARVLLSGLGADELFAGYTRHATAFNRRSFSGLLEELDLDISRLGKRNLGRDDRVISHWAREARFPFLDESLVRWAMASPVHEKCGFGETLGNAGDDSTRLEPGKKVLRCLAWKLGMRGVAGEKKRAVCSP